MIRINKPVDPPEVRFKKANHLKKGQLKWRVAQAKLLADYRTNPHLFNSERYKFNADFGRKEYQAALKACQGSKCCFCEKPLAIADIEHFRPKSGWQDAKGAPLNKPGYFWLAYSWSNMLIACTDCNSQSRKGNVFPVNGLRAQFPSDCRLEDPILINPTEEDPSRYITFRQEIPAGIDPNGRGAYNIDIFNLTNRADIAEIRRDRLRLYRLMKKQSLQAPGLLNTAAQIEEARRFIARAQQAKAPFAGMIRENIKHGFL